MQEGRHCQTYQRRTRAITMPAFDTIVSFRVPPGWSFPRFYELVRARGYVIYPGKLEGADTFRIGCIGAIDATAITRAVAAVAAALG